MSVVPWRPELVRHCGLALLALVCLDCSALAAKTVLTGQLIEGIACATDVSQTYTLYLPPSFDRSREWPVLFLFDPRGRSVHAAEIFRPAAEEYGWVILSSDNTRSDGPWEPNDRAMRAMWPEPFERWNGDPDRVYAGGFSGGAIAALVLAEMTGGLAGIIGVGGRAPDGVPITQTGYAHFGAAGLTDFNYDDMWKLDRLFAERGNPHRMEVFDGRHQWLPEELARVAIEWLEIVAMGEERRPRDAELIGRLFAKETAEAEALAADGRPLEALWRLQTISRTFDGLHDLEPLPERIAQLESSKEVRRLRKERQNWDRWEERYADRLAQVNYQILDQDPPLGPSEAIAAFGVGDLKKRAAKTDYEGTVARRILERVWTHTSFYMTRDLFAQGRYRSALTVLSVAVEIRDDSAFAWYNLACAAARSGHKRQAFDALERAAELGFRDPDHIAGDEDLASLRDEPRYRELIQELRAEQGE